jgi:hypothetical protein
MAITIEQQPAYRTLPAAQDMIFVVSDTVVSGQTRVKFIANVYISENKSGLGNVSNLVATLKTTPNGVGVGMFDLRQIVESFVTPDDLGNASLTGSRATYKGVDFSSNKQFPIHLIDEYSKASNSIKWFSVKFQIEYLVGNAVTVATGHQWSTDFLVFNGYVGNEDTLFSITTGGQYNVGYNLDLIGQYIQNDSDAKFLTNTPTTQYAKLTNYGTVATFSSLDESTNSFTTSVSPTTRFDRVVIKLYNSSSAQLGSDITSYNLKTTGGWQYAGSNAITNFLYFGVYPANLDGAYIQNPTSYGDWNTHKANVSYYTFQGVSSSGAVITQLYTVNIITDNCFGYEGVRLTWLNKLGAWDYYTFNQKSVRSVTTNKTPYTQLNGTWNESRYTPNGYKGGLKNFRVNAKERIKLNTDFLTDAASVWIEELLNSPNVYIVNESSTDYHQTSSVNSGIIHKYIEPVILTTSNFVRKTQANDNLIQYTIEVERNKDLRTQSI